MSDIDLDLIIKQREEARANGDVELYEFDWEEGETVVKSEGDTFSFNFGGKKWVARDPQYLTDEEKEELAKLNFDSDVAAWYMGEKRYDEFLESGGESWMFLKAFTEYQKKVQDEHGGNPTRPNRSSRRHLKRSKRG